MAFSYCLYSLHYVFAQTDQTSAKLQAANTAIDQAFNAVLDAEKTGANVTGLLAQLNVAGSEIAQAENSYRAENFSGAATLANRVLPIAQAVTASAQNAKQAALVSDRNNFWFTIAFSGIGAVVFVLVLFLIWRRFKRSYMKKLLGFKPEVIENAS